MVTEVVDESAPGGRIEGRVAGDLVPPSGDVC